MLRSAWRRRGVALGALALALAGCAYFNTFYAAKQNYARAQKLERDSKTDRLPPDAIKYYDKAIEKAAKVIVEIGGGWRAGIDDALFLMGASYYGKREYETAIGKFNELALNYPNSKHAPDALFYTGLCYHKLRDYEMGDKIFADLLRQHPRFPRRDEMLAISAEGCETERDLEGAFHFYRRLVDEFPKSHSREKALQRIGALQFDAGHFDSSLVAYQMLARETRSDETYLDAQLNAGACLVRLARYDDALAIYRRLLPDSPERNEQGGRVWLAMADAENRSGRYDDALEHLSLVVQNFENQSLAVEALYMKGYTFEVYQQDYEQARQAYQEAQGARTSSVFKEQATRRLENLARVQELAAADTARDVNAERLADAALKVAEFSLLDGNDPTKALQEYRTVVAAYPATKAARRADFARAWILYHDLDSVQAAGRILYDLADLHPESPQAKGAVELLTELGADSVRLAWLRAKVDFAQAAAQAETAKAETARAEAVAVEKAEEGTARPARTPRDTSRTRPGWGEPGDSLRHAPLSGQSERDRERAAMLERLRADSLDRGREPQPVDTLPPAPPADSLPPASRPEGP
jgi:tetratricopeptide (TPR) repeat protein